MLRRQKSELVASIKDDGVRGGRLGGDWWGLVGVGGRWWAFGWAFVGIGGRLDDSDGSGAHLGFT